MKILIISASNNSPSNSDTLSDSFIDGIKKKSPSVFISKIYIKDLNLDQFSLKHYEKDAVQGKDLTKLQKQMEECDAFVIATPIWNFGVPAHLKNAIDRMGSFALDEKRRNGTLGGKPFFCIFTGGAPLGAWAGLMRFTTGYIPEALTYFGATLFGKHFEPRCTIRGGGFGLVVHERPKSLELVKEKGASFAKEVELFLKTGKNSFKREIKKKFMKWGEKVISKIS